MLISAALVTVTAMVAMLAAAAPADAARLRTWSRLAHCESGGRWHINTGNGYYGGLQISRSTWRAYGGGRFGALPSRASKAHQIKVAERIKRGQGWRAWPACSARLGLR
jgi:resuscitation-promoting factor RpfA